jgi:long-chain fatty acid transport protein
MWLPVRGVRSLARGGAFVAGADDADALWQNPAGIAHAAGDGKRALLFDLALVYQPIEYTALDGTIASNEQPTQPVPSLAGSLGIGDRLVIAGGLAAPYAALHRYPADSAARFASVSWSSSAFVVATVGVAYAVNDKLRVGATLQNFFSKLSWSIVMSGCPPTATCDDADRTFDMPVDIDQTDYLSPSGSLGLQYDASPYATLGLAVQAPTRVAGTGTLTAKLPTNLMFDNGRIAGDEVAVSYTLPPSIRVGVEAHPLPNLEIEAALDIELWSMHDEIAIDTNEITLENVVGGPYPFGDMTIARDYGTSYSPALGVEYHAPLYVVGAGYAYESAAAPSSAVSPLTVDSAKHLFAIGGGYEDSGWQIGAAIAYVTAADVEVSLEDAKVTRLAPIRGAALDARVNAGSYRTSFVVAGLRFARRW